MAKKTGKKRKPNAAFMRPVTPSDTLAEVVGAKPMPRTEVTKKLWAYIKKNGLQDKKNKRMINADAEAQGGLRRQGVGQHVRHDEAGEQASQVTGHAFPAFRRGRSTVTLALRRATVIRAVARFFGRLRGAPDEVASSSRAAAALRVQRLRRTDLRSRLVPAARARRSASRRSRSASSSARSWAACVSAASWCRACSRRARIRFEDLRLARARHRRSAACSCCIGVPLDRRRLHRMGRRRRRRHHRSRGLAAAICLLPPTLLMGATLPAIARWIETTPQGRRLARFLLRRQHLRRGHRQPARRLLPAARLRRHDRDLRRSRAQRRRWRCSRSSIAVEGGARRAGCWPTALTPAAARTSGSRFGRRDLRRDRAVRA